MLVESSNRTRWSDKLRPAGASQKADGPEGPMAPVVTAGVLIVKKTFSHFIPCAGSHVNLSVSFHKRSTNCACHPSARAMQFSPYWEKKHAKFVHQYLHSRIIRVILAQRATQNFSAQKKKRRVILAQAAAQCDPYYCQTLAICSISCKTQAKL